MTSVVTAEPGYMYRIQYIKVILVYYSNMKVVVLYFYLLSLCALHKLLFNSGHYLILIRYFVNGSMNDCMC